MGSVRKEKMTGFILDTGIEGARFSDLLSPRMGLLLQSQTTETGCYLELSTCLWNT